MNTKSNIKVNDVAVWGGHDRKDIEDNNVVYDYYEIPTSLFDDNIIYRELIITLLSGYSGYSSFKSDDTNKTIVIDASGVYPFSSRGIVGPVLFKYPRYAFTVIDDTPSSYTCNSFPDFLAKIAERNSNMKEPVSQILQCTITEEEYNQKLEDIKNFI